MILKTEKKQSKNTIKKLMKSIIIPCPPKFEIYIINNKTLLKENIKKLCKKKKIIQVQIKDKNLKFSV